MKATDTLLYLQRNGMTVFTTDDLAKIIKKPISYTKTIVHKVPGVKKAERGLYYTEQANIYEIASNVVPFSYVSMLSALRFYDITTQMPLIVSVVSPKKHRKMELESRKIMFIRFKRDLIFGHVRRGNAFVAEPEKAVLDSLYHNEYAYLDEALEHGIDDKLVDVDKLIRYANVFKKKSLLNKLGFFLEYYAGISRAELLGGISKKPVSLMANAPNYNRKWRVYYG
jgi:predicted transcriptional regulator of viral defense system